MNVRYIPDEWNHLRLEFTEEYLEKKKRKKEMKKNRIYTEKLSDTIKTPKISRKKISKIPIEIKNTNNSPSSNNHNVKCVIL